MMGLLVLLNEHKGSEDVARLADDLDLEIDEILPSCDYADALGLVKVEEGRATLTEVGRRLLQGSIRDRKTLLREQLKKTTLFKALLRALEGSPERRLTEQEVHRLLAFTTAAIDDYIPNIINWGRYAELFRYDAEERVLLPARSRTIGRSPPSSPPSGPTAVRQTTGSEPPTGSTDDATPNRNLAHPVPAASG